MMKRIYLILGLSLLTACRSGSFENSRSFDVLDRVQIQLVNSRYEGPCAEMWKISAGEVCDWISAQLQWWSPQYQEALRHLPFDLNVQLTGSENLYRLSAVTNSEGRVQIEFPIIYSRYFQEEALPLLFEFKNSDFGSLFYAATYRAQDAHLFSDWQAIWEEAIRASLPSLSGRPLKASEVKAPILSRRFVNPQTQEVHFQIELQIQDAGSQVDLQAQKLSVQTLNWRTNEKESVEIEMSEAGLLKLPLRFFYRPYDHEYEQRLDLAIHALEEESRPPLLLTFILNFAESRENALVQSYPSVEIIEDHPWFRRGYRTASTKLQEIEIQDFWMQTFEYPERFEVISEFSGHLQRTTFDKDIELDLRNFQARVEIQAIDETSSESYAFETLVIDFEARPGSQSSEFKIAYSIPKTHGLRFADLKDFQFFMEIELQELLHIPPQKFLLDINGRVLRRWQD